MASKVFGEFMGTMILILMGNGSVANMLLKRSKAEGAGWLAITTGWAFAVMTGVFTAIACGSPDAHINPAITLGVAVKTGDFSKLAPYIVAQMLGAMAGAVLVWLNFLPHWAVTEDTDAKFACFGTAPAIDSRGPNLFTEGLGTFVLMLVVFAMGSKAIGTAPPGWGRTWWACWCGPSVSRWAGPPGTPSIRRAIWARASCTPCCPLRKREPPTGATPRSRCSAPWWAERWRACWRKWWGSNSGPR